MSYAPTSNAKAVFKLNLSSNAESQENDTSDHATFPAIRGVAARQESVDDTQDPLLSGVGLLFSKTKAS